MNEPKIRLVIAEDDFLVCNEVKRVLKGSRYEIIGEACNGKEAVEMTQELKPDAVIVDIKMPQMDGLQASHHISTETPTPIVILTAYESKELLEQASRVGVGAFLIKPPSFVEIDSAITIAIARHRDLIELQRLNNELEKALEEITTLKGFLPICCICGIIRDDSNSEPGKGVWMKMDRYLTEKMKAKVTHTYCPKCHQKELDNVR